MSAAKRLVDTNVLLVAEGLHDGVSAACRARCIKRLDEIKRSGHLVLDDGFRILNEYGNKLVGRRGPPGPGYAFYKWAHNSQRTATRCTNIRLTPIPGSADGNDFEEFPDHPGLAEFDRSDRKFVATAAAHGEPHPPIVQASDSKWIGWADALQAVGIHVEFLCHDELTSMWTKKKQK